MDRPSNEARSATMSPRGAGRVRLGKALSPWRLGARSASLAPRSAARSALFLIVAATPVLAQAHRNPATPSEIRHIQEIEPRTGPPGTVISVYTENLPPQGKVVLGIGSVGAGFEAMAEVEQGELGEVGGSVQIPESATWDRPLVVIAFNGNFAPTAHSDPFHVTNTDGLIRRTGRILDDSEACMGMEDSDGYFYTLTGELGSVQPGDDVVVEGSFQTESTCVRGETIVVSRLSRAEPTESGND